MAGTFQSQTTLEATQGQIPQMPPDSGGIRMGVDLRHHQLPREIDLRFAPGLPPGWGLGQGGCSVDVGKGVYSRMSANSLVAVKNGRIVTKWLPEEERQDCHEMVACPAIQAHVHVSSLHRAVVQRERVLY